VERDHSPPDEDEEYPCLDKRELMSQKSFLSYTMAHIGLFSFCLGNKCRIFFQIVGIHFHAK
jgi:hypothetical protein